EPWSSHARRGIIVPEIEQFSLSNIAMLVCTASSHDGCAAVVCVCPASLLLFVDVVRAWSEVGESVLASGILVCCRNDPVIRVVSLFELNRPIGDPHLVSVPTLPSFHLDPFISHAFQIIVVPEIELFCHSKVAMLVFAADPHDSCAAVECVCPASLLLF